MIEVMGKQLPRDDILKYSFVLKPLADVAADEVHVLSGKTYQQLWDEFTPKDRLIQLDE